MSAGNARIDRGTIARRCLSGRCPNCGEFGLFRHWFRLNPACRHCAMPLEREESGFYFGTTSIGYVFALLFVILPVCILVVLDRLEMWTGVALGIAGSVLLCVALYPAFLCWVILLYFLAQPAALPANSEAPPPPSPGG